MRLHPTWAVKVGAVMCALTLTALSPFPLTPTAGADEPATPADAPAAGTTTIDLLGITDLHGHISRTTQTDRNTGQTSVEDPGAVTLACEVSAARAANPKHCVRLRRRLRGWIGLMSPPSFRTAPPWRRSTRCPWTPPPWATTSSTRA